MQSEKDWLGMSDYPKISEADYLKAIGQFRTLVGTLLSSTYDMYGYQNYAAPVAQVIVDLAEQFGMRIRGKDVPIELPPYIQRRIMDLG